MGWGAYDPVPSQGSESGTLTAQEAASVAYFPCSVGEHPFPGKSSTVYPAVHYGSDMKRWKLRLCAKHAGAIEEILQPFEISDDTVPLPMRSNFPCLACGGGTRQGERRQFFMTAYFPKEDRRDFWGMLHDACSVPAVFQEPDDGAEQDDGGVVRGLIHPVR